MRAITLNGYGKAEAGITFVKDEFGFVPFSSRNGDFRVPLHRNLAESIIAAHAVMRGHHTRLAADVISYRERLCEAAPEVDDKSRISGRSKVDGGALAFVSTFGEKVMACSAEILQWYKADKANPLPLRFYQADLAKTGKGGPLLVPERDADDRRLLVHFSSDVGYKQTLRVKGPEGKVLASGWNNGFKRSMQTMLVWLEPGDELEVRMTGSTNTQSVSFERVYLWDGSVLTFEQLESNGTGAFGSRMYGDEGVKTRIIPAEVETKGRKDEQAVHAQLAEMFANRTKREEEVKVIQQQQLSIVGANSNLSVRWEALKAEAGRWSVMIPGWSYYDQPKVYEPHIHGDLTEESLKKAEEEFAGQLAELEKLWLEAKDARNQELAIAEADVEGKAKAEKEAREQKLREQGYPTDFTCHHERGQGRVNRQCWVIREDGRERDADEEVYARHKHLATRWNVIYPGEVALMWEKRSNASEHDFTVVHMLTENLSEEQTETLCAILEAIEQRWENARGLASGLPSPNVGQGWMHPKTGTSLIGSFRTSRQLREQGVLDFHTLVSDTPIVPVKSDVLAELKAQFR